MVTVRAVRWLGRGAGARATLSHWILLFVEIRQQISCGVSMIMCRAAVP
jgi:hypothetical protein